jgi:uncharacterized protein (DUF58 family)
VEKFIPPRKGRKHVLRVIREVLFFEPQRRGTNLPGALDFANRMLAHRAIMVLVSDFLSPSGTTPSATDKRGFQTAIKQANRRHDLVAVQVTDRFETELPDLGRLIFEDAESGEVVEINTGNDSMRNAFALRQWRNQEELARMFRSAAVDMIQLRTDQPYGAALGRFFETREKRRLRG